MKKLTDDMTTDHQADDARSGSSDSDAASLDRDALELHAALTDLLRVYQFRDRKRICCHDVSVTQCYALRELIERPRVTLNGLAQALYLDKSTTSRVVTSLVKKGYVFRRRSVQDGRVVHLEPTPAGVSLFEAIERHLIEQGRQLIADIDPEVRQATARLVARLARAARERLSPEDGTCCGAEDVVRAEIGDW